MHKRDMRAVRLQKAVDLGSINNIGGNRYEEIFSKNK